MLLWWLRCSICSPAPSRKILTLPPNATVPTQLSSYPDSKKQRSEDRLVNSQAKTIVHSQSAKQLPSHLPVPESGNQTFPKRSPIAKRRSQLPDFAEDKPLSASDPIIEADATTQETNEGVAVNHESSLTQAKRSTSVQSLPSVQKNGLDITSSPKQNRNEENGGTDRDFPTNVGGDKGRKSNFLKRTFFHKKTK